MDDDHIDEITQQITEAIQRLIRERSEALGIIARIQASLSEVAVYEEMPIGPGSVVQYVNELVRDHEELERRVDLALLEMRGEVVADPHRITKILQGHVPTPEGPA